jgi:hypothetical protein
MVTISRLGSLEPHRPGRPVTSILELRPFGHVFPWRSGYRTRTRCPVSTTTPSDGSSHLYRDSFKASLVPNPPQLSNMHTRNRRNGRLINVQALIPTLWARNSKRSQYAPPVRVVRERAHRHGPCARSSDLSLEARETLSEDDLEVHFTVTI